MFFSLLLSVAVQNNPEQLRFLMWLDTHTSQCTQCTTTFASVWLYLYHVPQLFFFVSDISACVTIQQRVIEFHFWGLTVLKNLIQICKNEGLQSEVYDSCSHKEKFVTEFHLTAPTTSFLRTSPGLQVLCGGTFCWTHRSVTAVFVDVHFEVLSVKLQLLSSWFFGARNNLVLMKWWSLGIFPDWIWWGAQAISHTLNIPLNVNIVYNKNFMLYWRRLESSDWDLKLTKKLFTDVFNQDRRWLIFP